MLLEVGMTVLDGVKDYTLRRDALSLETPDGKTLPLPSIVEHREGDTPRAADPLSKVQRDSINDFPPMASRACALDVLPGPDLPRDAGRRRRAQ